MHKENILVIDDEDFILQLAKDILERYNYAVHATSNGNEGLKLIDTEKFDLLLTDIRMPDISGLDIIRSVRKRNNEIPIIVITGHGTLDIAINALRLGAQGFLLKPFTPEELRTSVSEALEKTRLLSENIRMRALMPLFEVSKEIISEVDPTRLASLIIKIAVKETNADKAFLALMDEETGKLHVKECYGMSPSFEKDFQARCSGSLAAFILKDKEPFLVSSGEELPSEFGDIKQIEGISSGIYVPLSVRGKVIGLLFVCRESSRHPFTQSNVELVSVLSGQAAAAIENARLYEKLDKSYLSMIVTLSGVVESKDLYTDKHMKDIAEYSVEIAKKLGLADFEIENIRKAALLHDLGKVTVPDSILLKAGKLSEEEMDVIRKHPVHGAKMIESVEPIKHAREIIRHHHEYYDGSGYPDGLKAEGIPLGARIIAVADAFGAMTTHRPYRDALSADEAIMELEKFSGVQFDPDVVSAFIYVIREKGIIGPYQKTKD
jgi:putative nucleotidyltransferase with HDIG domain